VPSEIAAAGNSTTGPSALAAGNRYAPSAMVPPGGLLFLRQGKTADKLDIFSLVLDVQIAISVDDEQLAQGC
jgi:hypothetical protein